MGLGNWWRRKRTARRIRRALFLRSVNWKFDTSGDLTNGMRIIRRKRTGKITIIPTHTFSNSAIFRTLNK